MIRAWVGKHLPVFATIASTSKLIYVENFLLAQTDHPLKAVMAKGFAYLCLFGALYMGQMLPKWAVLTFSGVCCAYVTAQIEYMGYSGSPFLFCNVVGLWKELIPVLSQGGFFHPRAAWGIADLPLLTVVLWGRENTRQARWRLWILVGVIGFGAMGAIFRIKTDVFTAFSLSTRMKVGGFLSHEIVGTLERLRAGQNIRWGDRRQGLHNAGAMPRNVVLIQVESLDARLPWATASGMAVMPRLRALATEAMVFPYVMGYHGIGGSSDADFSMEYSAPPSRNVRTLLFAASGGQPLPKLLNPTHRTIFVHGNEGDFFGRRAAYTQAGFRELHFSEELKLPIENWGNTDGAVFESALELTRSSRPYFMHLITMSTHEPFDLWRTYYSTPEFQETLGRNYYRGFRYTDSVLGVFIDSLRKRANTWILVTGDHTPGDLVEGYRAAYVDLPQERLEFVPLLVFAPQSAGACDDSLVHSFMDFVPTVLSAAGSSSAFLGEGENLASITGTRGKRPILLPSGGTMGKRALRKLVDFAMTPSMRDHWDSSGPCGNRSPPL